MSIEFRCPTCTRLLRVGDDAAGKQANCPQCGTILWVPSPSSAPVPPPQPSAWPGPQGPTAPPPDADNPYRSPAAGAFEAQPSGRPGEIRATLLRVEDAFGSTWTIFKDRWGICLGAVVIIFLLTQVVPRMAGFVLQVVVEASHSRELAILGGVALGLIAMVFNLWITAGQTIFFLKVARGHNAELGDLFKGGPYLLTVFLTALLVGLMVCCGFILLIVPGIVLMLMFTPVFYVIVDRNVGVMEALGISRQITTGNKLTIFLIGLLIFLLFIPVIVTCGLGYLVWAPFVTLLWAVIYLQMTGQPTADQFGQSGY